MDAKMDVKIVAANNQNGGVKRHSFGLNEAENKKKVKYDADAVVDSEHYTTMNNAGAVGNSEHYMTMNNQLRIPVVQFGTYKMKGPACYTACLAALKLGYKGLDTASVYDNESEVGKAVADCGVDRSELFVQTKLWRSFVGKDPKNGKPKCDAELRKSLRKLGTTYVDMWLMHWPGPGRHLNYPPVKMGMDRPKVVLDKNKDKMVPLDWSPSTRLATWADMAKHVGPPGSGKPVRGAGVCNFSARQLRELLEFCDDNGVARPAVVQNECHPLLQAAEVRKICEEEGIVFQAYASLGAGALGLVEDGAVRKVAGRRGRTEGQVLLRWAVQKGCAVLPKSVREERMRSNLDVVGWKLEEEDMELLDGCETAGKDQNTMAGWLREHDPDFY